MLDDIDRLSTSEIRDVFKLVRLTASFSNVIYIVAFDRARVEEALAEQGVPGRSYLEKILQVAVDLPAVPSDVLNRQIFSAIDNALTDIESPGPFDEIVWPDVFMEVIRPLIRNMRDVRRYAAAIQGTVRSLDGQIALEDVLSLEAIRVFLPDVFGQLHSAVDGLTTTSGLSYGGSDDPPNIKKQIDDLIEAAGIQDEVVRAMINRLFPAAERFIGGSNYGPDWKARWLRDRHVAHADILRFYLERMIGEGLQAFTYAEQAWSRIADGEALNMYLRSIDAERLQDVIGSLEAYEDQFAPEHVVPGTVVLLNLLPDLPERPRGMFEIDTRLVVTRVMYRLLRSVGDLAGVEAVVRQILPSWRRLSSKLEVINTVGYREGIGHKLVSESAAAAFEKEWREEVRLRAIDHLDLAREYDLLRVFLLTKREGELSESPFNISDEPPLTLALLRAARSDSMSQSMGSRAVRRSSRLAWDALIELFGAEVALQERIERLKATESEDIEDLIELAGKYLGGWRPNNFCDD